MDGTWYPPYKKIIYVICQSCKELVKKDEITNRRLKICRKCAQI